MRQPPFSFARHALTATMVACLALVGCGGGDSSAGDTGATVAAPSITTQPTSLTLASGATGTLSVVASGSSLGYQWYLNGSAISGATASSLTVSSAGSYHVVVSNTGGSVTSSAATVTVSGASTGSDSESWTLSTGANSNDLAADSTTFQTVNIALGGLAVTSGSSALSVDAAGTSARVTDASGGVVATIAQDAYGITITSTATSALPLAFALSGSYAGSVTIHSDQAFRLDLNAARITSADGPAINIQSKKRAFVVLTGSSTLADAATYSTRTLADGSEMDLKAAFFSEGALIFSGSGSLSVTSSAKHALASDAHVRLRAGALTLASNAKDGIRANDAFVMDGGTLKITTATGAGKGIKVEGKEDEDTPLGFIAINGGTIDITSYDKGITASWEAEDDADTATTADDPDPRVTINGGTITVATTGTAVEDVLSPEGIESKSTLTINGGTLTITTDDDALNAETAIVINGGRIYARATSNDAIDSNGTLTITGGVVVAIGAGAPEGGLDTDQNTFTVTGGTFVGIGGSNSTPTQSTTTQNTVALGSVSAGTLVIGDASGKAAFAYTVPAAASAMLLSSPHIATSTTYTVYQGSTVSGQDETYNGLYVGSGMRYSGGTAGSSFTVSSTVTSLGGTGNTGGPGGSPGGR
ncbi:carbohydrate-binding domain-containing protein [Ottowia sp.]|uniref:carbohydrate-binding domain-containing protein n=1 Tax=Ottowia sp. TaxID=1898956 RepID=UPI0039E32D6E